MIHHGAVDALLFLIFLVSISMKPLSKVLPFDSVCFLVVVDADN